MLANLALASLLVVVTVIIHFAGLLVLTRMLDARGHKLRAHRSVAGQFVLLVLVVLGLIAIHTIEIWLYALTYLAVGALGDLESALYFSTVTFSTIGYGDIVLGPEWRLFGAIEAANALILFGWSTAFLISITAKLRSLEHEWLDREPERGDAAP
jgi:hypothetical protein